MRTLHYHNKALTLMVSPVVAFGIVWIIQSVAYFTLPINLPHPDTITWGIVVTGFLSLLTGALAFGVPNQLVMQSSTIANVNSTRSDRVSWMLLYTSIISSAIAALFLIATIERNEIGLLHSLKENILAESVAGNKLTTYFIYLFVYQNLLTLYYFNCNGFQKNKRTVLVFIAAILSALMSGSRGLLIFFLIALIPCIICKKHEINFNGKVLGKLFAIIVIFFFVYPFVFQGMSVEGEDDWLSLRDYISVYLFSGIAAFNDYLQTNDPNYDCLLLAPRPALRILDALWQTNLASSCPASYEEKLLPLQTNVYSVFFAPYHDFGLAGVIFYLFVIGFVSQMAFTKGCLQNNNTWRFFYGILFYSIIFSFFDDQFARGAIYYSIGFTAIIFNRLAGGGVK